MYIGQTVTKLVICNHSDKCLSNLSVNSLEMRTLHPFALLAHCSTFLLKHTEITEISPL